VSEWQPIETAPKDGTRVLLGFMGGTVLSGSWRHGWAADGSLQNDLRPTHWQPLPNPPA